MAVTPAPPDFVHVVAGIIHCPDRERILIARRPQHLHQGGLWEFPGGKVHPGEAPRAALARELEEELAISPTAVEPFSEISHAYPDKTVLLEFWRVTAFIGTPRGNEGQQIAWVLIPELLNYDFPAANQAVIDKLLG